MQAKLTFFWRPSTDRTHPAIGAEGLIRRSIRESIKISIGKWPTRAATPGDAAAQSKKARRAKDSRSLSLPPIYFDVE
jgi:hypothetical protein